MKLPPNSAVHKEDEHLGVDRVAATRPRRPSPIAPLSRYHQYIAPKAPPYMGNNKKKSKASSNGNRPRNGSRSTTAHVGTAALGRPVERSSTRLSQPATSAPTPSPTTASSIPTSPSASDVEKDRHGAEHVRYEVEGNLDAPVPPIRDSKYLDKQQCHRDLPLHAAQPQNGSRARKSLQARQGRRRSLLRTRPGSLLLRLRLRARQRRLVRAHDPQPGIAPGPRLRAPATP